MQTRMRIYVRIKSLFLIFYKQREYNKNLNNNELAL